MIRAKAKVTSVTSHDNMAGKTIQLNAEYDEKIPEDQRFSEATPSFSLTMYVTNPLVLERMTQGKYFYIEFIDLIELK